VLYIIESTQYSKSAHQIIHVAAATRALLFVVLVLLQVAGARAERDTLADQNTALARTTHQLMAGTAAPGSGPYGSSGIGSINGDGVGGRGSAPPGPSASAPVSLNGAAADGSCNGQGLLRQRALSDPSAATAAGGGTGGPAAAAGGGGGGGASAAAARITSGQLRDIGAMLARLTRENAALIKQRDKLETSAAEASRAAAAAEAAAAERQSLLQERAVARAELEAARADYSRATASVKQLTAERDRLLQQVRLHVLLLVAGRPAHYPFSAGVPECHNGKSTQLVMVAVYLLGRE